MRRYEKGKGEASRRIRFREHPTRRHGTGPDKCFFIRFKVDAVDKKTGKPIIDSDSGKVKRVENEEALGWASEGWTETKALARLAELKENQRIGVGPVTLSEKRSMETQRRQEGGERQKEEQKDAPPFGEYC